MPDDPETAATRDLEAMAALGWGPERWNDLSVKPGQLADFMSLDLPMRTYVLKVLSQEATTADDAWFREEPDSKVVAKWMLSLPAFEAVEEYDDDMPSTGADPEVVREVLNRLLDDE
jgi:hypothetical protein